jgi:hypothetical protein
MSCTHDLDAEFLYPSDADVLDIYEETDGLRVKFALPCPECGAALEIDASIESVTEGDFELPLDDERYD